MQIEKSLLRNIVNDGQLKFTTIAPLCVYINLHPCFKHIRFCPFIKYKSLFFYR